MDVFAAPASTCPSGSEAGSGGGAGTAAVLAGGSAAGVGADALAVRRAEPAFSATVTSFSSTGTRDAPAQAPDTMTAPVTSAAAAFLSLPSMVNETVHRPKTCGGALRGATSRP